MNSFVYFVRSFCPHNNGQKSALLPLECEIAELETTLTRLREDQAADGEEENGWF